MGCVHADGGNPRYVCNACEKDEPGLRARNRVWVRGDVLPETTGDLTIQDMININKVKFESHGTETRRFSTKTPNMAVAPSIAAVPHKITGQRVPQATGGEVYYYTCVKCHRQWEKNIYMPPGVFPQDCSHRVVETPAGKVAIPGGPETEYERGRLKGSQEMLDMIRGSLEGYPDLGGDIEVMREVDRIVNDAIRECQKLNRSLQEETRKLRDTLGAIQDLVEEVI